jgi:hypothetical protein
MVGCWMFGLVWIATLSELARSEAPWLIGVARGAFVVGLSIVLGATVVIAAAGNTTFRLSSSGFWGYSLGCAIPVSWLAFLVARRTFNRKTAVAIAMLPAVALLAATAAAFRPAGNRLGGLAATAHRHHALVVAALAFAVAAAATTVALPRKRRIPD